MSLSISELKGICAEVAERLGADMVIIDVRFGNHSVITDNHE